MNLNSVQQACHIIESFLPDALCMDQFHCWSSCFWSKQGCQRRWPCPVLSFLFLCQGTCWLSCPSLLLHCYLPWDPLKFHVFHEVLQLLSQFLGFGSSFSFIVSSQKSGFIILRLVDVKVSSLPQKRNKVWYAMVILHFLWILIGMILALVAGAL